MDEGGGQVWCIGMFTLFSFIVKRNALKTYECAVRPRMRPEEENCATASSQTVQRCNALNPTPPRASQKERKINEDDANAEVVYMTAVCNPPAVPSDEQCEENIPPTVPYLTDVSC